MKIAVFINSRANYGRIKSFLKEAKSNKSIELKIVVGASGLLPKYGKVLDLIKQDGFQVDYELNFIIEGDEPINMAKSTGLGIIETSSAIQNLKPDAVLTIADRYETLATAVSASYMNIPIIHTQGGDQTGSIDESVRHAITKLSHIHFPASELSKKRIIAMGEDPKYVFNVGCPSIDLIKDTDLNYRKDMFNNSFGIGDKIDFQKPYVVVLMHPVTTEYINNSLAIKELVKAIIKISNDFQIVWLWPNIDSGSEIISKTIRLNKEYDTIKNIHLYKNFPPNDYLVLINQCKCLIGNSSSGLREGAFLGVPVVNIGNRQKHRESSINVTNVNHNSEEIYQAIIKQANHKKYSSSKHLGDGNSGKLMCEILTSIKFPNIQKELHY
tara:strand:- start:6034 stop:7185 length:1152 start_codon:yes stop_codon:yes gene_type:complete